MQRLLLIVLLGILTIGSAQAAGQYGEQRSMSGLIGLYSSGVGGVFGYAQPFAIEGLARSGLGLVVEGQLGAGIGDNQLTISALVGPKLVFMLNQTSDLYVGVGVGGELTPDSGIGAGASIGTNFQLNGTRTFIEGGLHPGNHLYLGTGLRF